jgi:hypothetical protein
VTSKRKSEFQTGAPAAKPQVRNTKWNIRANNLKQEHPFVYPTRGRGQSGESSN